MTGCNAKQTPYVDGAAHHAPAPDDEYKPGTETKFKQLIGELRYLADCTRLDLSFIVGRLGAAEPQPTARHWQLLKATMRYLAGKRNYGIIYRRRQEITDIGGEVDTQGIRIMAYSDADWANDRGDRKSITGGVIYYNEVIVDWTSHKQQAVAQSTAEAEYRAMVELVQRAVFTRNRARGIYQEPGKDVDGQTNPDLAASDKQPAIDMLTSLGGTKRSKFIDMRHGFIKDQVENNDVKVVHVPSDEQNAEIFTKPLGRIKFSDNRERIGVVRIEEAAHSPARGIVKATHHTGPRMRHSRSVPR